MAEERCLSKGFRFKLKRFKTLFPHKNVSHKRIFNVELITKTDLQAKGCQQTRIFQPLILVIQLGDDSNERKNEFQKGHSKCPNAKIWILRKKLCKRLAYLEWLEQPFKLVGGRQTEEHWTVQNHQWTKCTKTRKSNRGCKASELIPSRIPVCPTHLSQTNIRAIIPS